MGLGVTTLYNVQNIGQVTGRGPPAATHRRNGSFVDKEYNNGKMRCQNDVAIPLSA